MMQVPLYVNFEALNILKHISFYVNVVSLFLLVYRALTVMHIDKLERLISRLHSTS